MNSRILAVGSRQFISDISKALVPPGIEILSSQNIDRLKNIPKKSRIGAVILDADRFKLSRDKVRGVISSLIGREKTDIIVISSSHSKKDIMEALSLGARDFIPSPFNRRELITRTMSVLQKKVRIACIGGGTGLFHILLGLKTIPNVLLTSVVSTSDDGGSSGKLKTSFGILPPGDVRRSLVALSNAPEIMNEVMRYRFRKGEGISGHSFGNLFLAALSDIKGSLSEAVKSICNLLHVEGIVLPVTNTQTTLYARFEDGTIIKGESNIDLSKGRNPDLHISDLWHEPETKCNIEALSAVVNADIVIIGPGDLFTSVITNLIVKNMREALSKTSAKIVYLCNLMTEPGETAHFTAFDHVSEIVKYMGGDFLDYIILSNTKISAKARRRYHKKKQEVVSAKDLQRIGSITKAKIMEADVGHDTELVRHNSMKLSKIMRLIIQRERRRARACKQN